MLGLLSCESIWSTTIDPKQVRIVFFIAGYVSRSAIKSTACSGCKGMLSKSNDLTHLQFEEPGTSAEKEAREEYVSLINRGGLWCHLQTLCMLLVFTLFSSTSLFLAIRKLRKHFCSPLSQERYL
jgi:hypothetical protein